VAQYGVACDNINRADANRYKIPLLAHSLYKMITTAQERQLSWAIVAFFFAGIVLSYADRAVLGVVLPQVRKDLALTNAQYSLTIDAFLILYMIFYIVGGRIADRLGIRRAFSLNIVFWSLASMAHAIAGGVVSLCVFRALLGVGEGGFFPTAMRGILEWCHPENRAKAVGLLICGVSLGMLLTPPIAAWMTFHFGWRMAFLVTGSAPLFLVFPWSWLHRRIHVKYGIADRVPARSLGNESPVSSDISLRQVLGSSKYWFFLFARAFPDAVTFFYLFWLPGYFQDVRHYDLKKVGTLLWIPFFCAGLGALGGGWLSGALMQRGLGMDRSRKIALFLSAACPILGAGAFLAPTAIFALVLVSLALFGHFAWAANIQTVVTEIMPPRHVATLYGVTGAAGTLMAVLTQPLVGYTVDFVGYGPAFVGTAVIYLLALGMLHGAGTINHIQ
jgi:ACS family hexuronate transporter-like MFS transporter